MMRVNRLFLTRSGKANLALMTQSGMQFLTGVTVDCYPSKFTLCVAVHCMYCSHSSSAFGISCMTSVDVVIVYMCVYMYTNCACLSPGRY